MCWEGIINGWSLGRTGAMPLTVPLALSSLSACPCGIPGKTCIPFKRTWACCKQTQQVSNVSWCFGKLTMKVTDLHYIYLLRANIQNIIPLCSTATVFSSTILMQQRQQQHNMYSEPRSLEILNSEWCPDTIGCDARWITKHSFITSLVNTCDMLWPHQDKRYTSHIILRVSFCW